MDYGLKYQIRKEPVCERGLVTALCLHLAEESHKMIIQFEDSACDEWRDVVRGGMQEWAFFESCLPFPTFSWMRAVRTMD